jgi:hypothetical protein
VAHGRSRHLRVRAPDGAAESFIGPCPYQAVPDMVENVWPTTIVQASSTHNHHAEMVSVATCTAAVRTFAELSPSPRAHPLASAEHTLAAAGRHSNGPRTARRRGGLHHTRCAARDRFACR